MKSRARRRGPALDIEVRDFGPVRRGRVSLKPLTVFVGPNNSGKSCAAALVHSVLNALSAVPGSLPEGAARPAGTGKTGRQIPRPCPERADLVESAVMSELSWNFASDVRALVRKGAGSFSVEVASKAARLRITQDGARISGRPARGAAEERAPGAAARRRSARIARSALAADLIRSAPGPSSYLPSSRTGVLRALEASGCALKAGPRSPVPGLSGIAADFARIMASTPSGKTRLADVAGDIESGLLGAEIVPARPGELAPRVNLGGSVLRAASSAAAELAPLVLCVRHVLDAGSVLIFEELETCLHPAGQLLLLARILAKLVGRGLNMLVITHSPYLLEQLSHLVQAGALSPAARAKTTGSRSVYLRADEVATYAFAGGARGSRIEPVAASAREGIPQEEFVRVNEAMYDELQRIERSIA